MPAISLGYLGVKYLELGSPEPQEPKTGVAIEVVNRGVLPGEEDKRVKG